MSNSTKPPYAINCVCCGKPAAYIFSEFEKPVSKKIHCFTCTRFIVRLKTEFFRSNKYSLDNMQHIAYIFDDIKRDEKIIFSLTKTDDFILFVNNTETNNKIK